MQTCKILSTYILGALLIVAHSLVTAAPVVCTAPTCLPDFSAFTTTKTAAIPRIINYTWDSGSQQGTLSVQANMGNALFEDGQIDSPWPGASETAVNPNQPLVLAASASGNDNYDLNVTVDGSGNLIGAGTFTMNGRVGQFWSNVNNTNPNFQIPGIYTVSSGGVALDGALAAAGTTVTDFGGSGLGMSWVGNLDPTSLLVQSGLSNGFVNGTINLLDISSSDGLIQWQENWTARANMSTAVPVPTAFWLFMSGIMALFSMARTKK